MRTVPFADAVQRTIYQHDERGNIISSVETTTSIDGQVISSIITLTYEYDQRSRLVHQTEERVTGGRLLFAISYDYLYDAHDNLISIVGHQGESVLMENFFYE